MTDKRESKHDVLPEKEKLEKDKLPGPGQRSAEDTSYTAAPGIGNAPGAGVMPNAGSGSRGGSAPKKP